MTVSIPNAPSTASRASHRLRPPSRVVETAPDPGKLAELWMHAARNKTQKAQAPQRSQQADTVKLADLWRQSTETKRYYAEGPQDPSNSQPGGARRMSTAAHLKVRADASAGRVNARSVAANAYRGRSSGGMQRTDTSSPALNLVA